MKKTMMITAAAVAGLSLLCSCGKTPVTEPTSAPAATEQPQATKSPTELVIGEWTINEVSGLDDASAANPMVEKLLKKGTTITITDDHKIKFGVLSAEYTEEGFDTLTVTSSLLPSSIDIQYTVDESNLTATVTDKYTAKCTRDK